MKSSGPRTIHFRSIDRSNRQPMVTGLDLVLSLVKHIRVDPQKGGRDFVAMGIADGELLDDAISPVIGFDQGATADVVALEIEGTVVQMDIAHIAGQFSSLPIARRL